MRDKTLTNKSFSTSPKTRRHVRNSISGDRARDFMWYLWQLGFRTECMYKGLRNQFIQFFETNDPRVIEKYIGRPKLTVEYGREQVVRRKQSMYGVSIAQFEYAHKRECSPKRGLMEMLGYLILDAQTGFVQLCHESQPYYTVQTELAHTRTSKSPPLPPLPKSNESSISKQDLCVHSIEEHSRKTSINKGRLSDCRGLEVSEWETGSSRRKKKKKYRPHTHKTSILPVITQRKKRPRRDRLK